MRNTTINNNSTKEMNIKKKDKKDLNGGLNTKKKNSKDTSTSNQQIEHNVNNNQQQITLNNNDQDQTNDKNNNLTNSTQVNATNDIIPESSINNHQLSSINNTVVSSTNVVNENNLNNLNHNQLVNKNSNKQTDNSKRNEKKVNSSSSSVNQSRKSSANLEVNSNNKSTNDNQTINNDLNQLNCKDDDSRSISSIVSNGIQGIESMYIVSDSEVPEEGDFKIVKYKQLRRKKQKKGSNQEESIRLIGGQELTTNQPQSGKQLNYQNKKELKNPATARGYESESDYCAVEGRKKGGFQLKRDVLLDNSTTKKNNCSISNSDSDSINSSSNEDTASNQLNNNNMFNPIVEQTLNHFTPSIQNKNVSFSKISYAAIAKKHYSTTTNGAAFQTTNNLTNNSNLTTTNQQSETKKEISKKINKNLTNDKKDKTNKSITSEDSMKSKDSKDNNDIKDIKDNQHVNGKKIDDKRPDYKQQSIKKSNKFNKTDSTESNSRDEKITATEFINESNESTERTVSLDLNFTPSVFSSSPSKSNSSFNSNPPAVIMLDNKNINQDTQFTFGFFDENAQFQNNVIEEHNEDEQFKSINVNSVNFIGNAKESNVNSNQNGILKNKDKNGSPKIETISTPTTISVSTIMNSSLANLPIVNKPLNNIVNNTPISEGTYIMECEENICDNLTKKVQDTKSPPNDYRKGNRVNNFVSIFFKHF